MPYFQQAFTYAVKASGEEAPETAAALDQLADARRALGDVAEAERLYGQALREMDGWLAELAGEVA